MADEPGVLMRAVGGLDGLTQFGSVIAGHSGGRRGEILQMSNALVLLTSSADAIRVQAEHRDGGPGVEVLLRYKKAVEFGGVSASAGPPYLGDGLAAHSLPIECRPEPAECSASEATKVPIGGDRSMSSKGLPGVH